MRASDKQWMFLDTKYGTLYNWAIMPKKERRLLNRQTRKREESPSEGAKPMIKLTARVEEEKETGLFASFCPQIGIASQGKTEGEAVRNLEEAVALYLEEVTENHDRELLLA